MIKENQTLFNRINILTDGLCLAVSMLLAYIIRFSLLLNGVNSFSGQTYVTITLVLTAIQFVTYSLFNLYGSFRSISFSKEIISVVNANFIMLAISLSTLFIFKLVDISRWLIVIFILVNCTTSILKRLILRKTLTTIRQKGYNLKNIIIVGSKSTAARYLSIIKTNKKLGFSYCGYISDDDNFEGERLGSFSDITQILSSKKPDEVICAIDISDAVYLESIVSACEKTGTKISIIPFCYQYIPANPYIDQIEDIPLINIRRIPLDNLGNAFIKRFIDIILSIIFIIISSPVMIVTAFTIKATSKGPVIFKQQRVGLNKREFTMYKFRSMVINNSQDTAWSTPVDPRKTKFGSFIRKFSIDELPQFFNVLKGDMSIVGPRPEIPHFVDNFKESIPLYMVKHQVKPGITGLAQINGYRGDTSIQKRIEFDIKYIENWNILLDIDIILKTIFKGLKNKESLN